MSKASITSNTERVNRGQRDSSRCNYNTLALMYARLIIVLILLKADMAIGSKSILPYYEKDQPFSIPSSLFLKIFVCFVWGLL